MAIKKALTALVVGVAATLVGGVVGALAGVVLVAVCVEAGVSSFQGHMGQTAGVVAAWFGSIAVGILGAGAWLVRGQLRKRREGQSPAR